MFPDLKTSCGCLPKTRILPDAGFISPVTALRKVVFVEPQFNPKIAEVIAKECGAKVLYLDPIGGQKGRETYIDMMRYNIAVMESVMK